MRKKTFYLLPFALVSLFINFTSAQVSSFPYEENFDSWSLCNSGNCTSLSCPAPNGWTQPSSDNRDWYVRDNNTPSFETGPDFDHTTGSGNYLYTENSGCSNQLVDLESPWFDFSGIPVGFGIKAGFWYHMYGSNMGTLRFDYRIDNAGSIGSWTNIWTLSGIKAING